MIGGVALKVWFAVPIIATGLFFVALVFRERLRYWRYQRRRAKGRCAPTPGRPTLP